MEAEQGSSGTFGAKRLSIVMRSWLRIILMCSHNPIALVCTLVIFDVSNRLGRLKKVDISRVCPICHPLTSLTTFLKLATLHLCALYVNT